MLFTEIYMSRRLVQIILKTCKLHSQKIFDLHRAYFRETIRDVYILLHD